MSSLGVDNSDLIFLYIKGSTFGNSVNGQHDRNIFVLLLHGLSTPDLRLQLLKS